MSTPTAERHPNWKWYVCGLMMLATMLNYMDRLTLSQLSVEVKGALTLSNEQYGEVETGFGIAFAIGALVFGYVADRFGVRWLYPAVLLAWSGAGVATAWANSFESLMACRVALGFFEAGQWPCALKTSQRLLSKSDRTLGNSILQGGASFGAILTPQIVNALVTTEPDSWRLPFLAIGFLGILWVFPWLWMVRTRDLAPAENENAASLAVSPAAAARELQPEERSWRGFMGRFALLVVVVISINFCWHFFRVWMPMYLRESRGYERAMVNNFTSAFYIATEVGCIMTGIAVRMLCTRGWRVHAARLAMFLVCSLLCALSWLVTLLPNGWPLFTTLLLIAFGSLGLFPIYYALSQDISVRHQGKVTGALGFINWIVISPMQKYVGVMVDETQSFDFALQFVGLAPLVGFFVLALFWRDQRDREG